MITKINLIYIFSFVMFVLNGCQKSYFSESSYFSVVSVISYFQKYLLEGKFPSISFLSYTLGGPRLECNPHVFLSPWKILTGFH